MSISTISQISGLLPTQATNALSGSAASGSVSSGSVSSGIDFASVASAVNSVEKLQDNADALAIKAVTGDLDDVHDYTIAASQASVGLELTAALRNKAVEAFNEIMRMQA